jgi:hypothetical protein
VLCQGWGEKWLLAPVKLQVEGDTTVSPFILGKNAGQKKGGLHRNPPS